MRDSSTVNFEQLVTVKKNMLRVLPVSFLLRGYGVAWIR